MTRRTEEAGPRGGFTELGLGTALLTVLDELGYEEPTPIQRDAIPPLLAGRDVVGQAATGTGKTAAFALPLLQRLFGDGPAKPKAEGPAALVLVPTRELAMQVAEAIHRYGRALAVRVLPVYGGQSIGLQLQALRRGVDVVVATPGRALDHLRRGTLALGRVRAVVLDEADEMLDMGFAEDLEAILDALPEERQVALFSATMPGRIAAIAQRHLDNPVRFAIAEEKTPRGEAPRVRHLGYLVSRAQKLDALGRILDVESPTSALVFCRTRVEVEELARKLNGRGHRAEALHGGMSQRDRDRVMGRFREGAADLLLATDVAARGLDIGRLSHVVNYDVPPAPETYVHRVGRTGRAGREGVAITLAEPRERPLLRNIERLTGRALEMAAVPTVADLRARRLELTRASLREAVLGGGNEGFRVVVESLADEFDLLDLAAAAVRVAFEATERPGEAEAAREGQAARGAAAERALSPETRAPAPPKPRGVAATAAGPKGDFVRLYVSAGRAVGVRPADLVGAITGEAGLQGGDIGAIEIEDRFSLVEVREDRAEDVLQALRSATLRGRSVTASRYRTPVRAVRAAPRSAPRPTTTPRRKASPARPGR